MDRRGFVGLMLAGCGISEPDINPTKITGTYHVEEVGGVWWMVTPDGDRQISLGVNHVQPLLMLGPHNREATLGRYGADFVTPGSTGSEVLIHNAGFELASDFNPYGEGAKKWYESIQADFDAWGFNALGYHTTLPRHLFRLKLSYVQPIAAMRLERYSNRAGLELEYPDPFAEPTRKRIAEVMLPLCRDCSEDRNLIGWAFNDVPRWQAPKPPSLHPWVRAMVSLTPASPAKRKWVELLQLRHGEVASACQAHGVQAARWLDLLGTTDWPEATTDAAHSDGEAFLATIAEQWYRTQYWTVKRCDRKHLILGDKLAGSSIPDYLLDVLKRYVDVVYVQWYGRMEEQRDRLIEIHRKTGKPILLGDSSFSVVAEGQQAAKGIHVNTQAEVGEEYYRYLKAAMELPFVVGWHHCGYVEGRPGIGAHFPGRQCGFVDPWGNVHTDAITRVQEANKLAERWHAAAKPV
ncbi:MAG: hypothetical protein GY953_37605 [bacterium]|nr:hypothetical protein [bacterium]